MGRILSGLLLLVYIVVGVVVAQSNDYFADLGSVESILSAILAVLLWPLVLLDVSLQIGEGSIDKPEGESGSGEKPQGGGEGSGGKPSGGGN